MQLNIPIEKAYSEACQALGEEVVKGRLLEKWVSENMLGEAVDIVEEGAKGGPDDQGDKQGGSPPDNGVSRTPA